MEGSPQEVKELLQFISEGGSVVRFHTRPGIRPDTDAAHSHGVAMLCSILTGNDERGCTRASLTLIMSALTHDLAEQKPGDVSAPAKRLLGMGDSLAKVEHEALRFYGLDYERFLNPTELSILKLADSFDGMMYCCREAALGNRNVRLIWGRYCSYIEIILAPETMDMDLQIRLRASNVYEGIKQIYQEATSASGPAFDVFASE